MLPWNVSQYVSSEKLYVKIINESRFFQWNLDLMGTQHQHRCTSVLNSQLICYQCILNGKYDIFLVF